MKNSYIGQAWLVLMLAICFGAALAGVQVGLKDRIDANKLADTLDQIPTLVPGAMSGELEILGDQSAYKATDASGEHVGWDVPAAGQGFADRIELLVGLNVGLSEITGLYVLDQKETPGLGNKITFDDWRGQFAGKPAGGLSIVKGAAQSDTQVEAVTGATISSESVVSIVNGAVAKFRAALGG